MSDIWILRFCLCCVVLPCVVWRNCVNKLYRFPVHNIHAYVLPCNERNIPVCCKFTQLHSNQILLKSVNIWLSYCKKQKGELFLKHSVYIMCQCASDVILNAALFKIFVWENVLFLTETSCHFNIIMKSLWRHFRGYICKQ